MWQHNSVDINLEEGGRFTADKEQQEDDELEATLIIRDLEAGDLGQYTCTGGSAKGEASGNIELSGRTV